MVLVLHKLVQHATLTGLIPDSAYTAQVHAVCAPGDTSGASPASSFTTSCTASVAPTNENFDARVLCMLVTGS